MAFVFVILLQAVIIGFVAFGIARLLFRQASAARMRQARQIVMAIGLVCVAAYALIFTRIVWHDVPTLFSVLPPIAIGVETLAVWLGLLAGSRGRV